MKTKSQPRTKARYVPSRHISSSKMFSPGPYEVEKIVFYFVVNVLIHVYCEHGLTNYKDTKTKCRHLKQLICKKNFAAGVYQNL
jgi:hypothetical protein